MPIEAHISCISSQAASLRSQGVAAINAVKQEVLVVAESEIPASYESQDMRVFAQKLSDMSNKELKLLADTMDSYAASLDSVASAYREAQINALTNALMF